MEGVQYLPPAAKQGGILPAVALILGKERVSSSGEEGKALLKGPSFLVGVAYEYEPFLLIANNSTATPDTMRTKHLEL